MKKFKVIVSVLFSATVIINLFEMWFLGSDISKFSISMWGIILLALEVEYLINLNKKENKK